jgi:hypothetical protein
VAPVAGPGHKPARLTTQPLARHKHVEHLRSACFRAHRSKGWHPWHPTM